MSDKQFRFVDPDTSSQIVAQMIDEKSYRGLCALLDKKGKKRHAFEFVMEVTQWGFEGSKSIVVARCARTGLCVAFEVTTDYEVEKTDADAE